jgi:hypothetical protein
MNTAEDRQKIMDASGNKILDLLDFYYGHPLQ